jgi:hypothetical protein
VAGGGAFAVFGLFLLLINALWFMFGAVGRACAFRIMPGYYFSFFMRFY